jgi:pimeloyl-ACP methyl ester carboxylesterase
VITKGCGGDKQRRHVPLAQPHVFPTRWPKRRSIRATFRGVQIVDLVVWMSAVIGGGFFVTVGLYALGSFVLMRPHTSARPVAIWFRELVREAALAVLTQPLLPIFYLCGHRMGGPTDGRVPVVFVHGYMQNRAGFLGLARALARRGVGPLYGFNYPWFASIESNAERLERFIARVCRETASDAVDLVCHSMGGLVGMEMLRREARGAHHSSASPVKVRRFVTIATPHAGVAWRGPVLGIGATSLRRGSKLLEAHSGYAVKVPTLSVFSTHDNIVHPKETSQLAKRGGRDVEIDGIAHLAILFSEAVAEHVAAFLREPGPVASEEKLERAAAGLVPTAGAPDQA